MTTGPDGEEGELSFNSWAFFAFAAAVVGLYHLLSQRWQNRVLLLASYAFYGAWDHRFLSLVAVSTGVDYAIGRALERRDDDAARKRLLLISCAVNLGILGFFKYFNFFVDSALEGLGHIGVDAQWDSLRIILPVGISFYTFQSMSYTIDVYRRRMPAERNILDFALFVAYFPQLVAGPIERATTLLPALKRARSTSAPQIRSGAWLIFYGLFKKVVIADNLAIFVDQAFGATRPASGLVALVAVYAFAFQIYCDFSGYTDIARGVSKLMGIDLMRNFDRPYIAASPTDFWRRWHISLSTWLRDYLYVPLGGNRGGKLLTYRNLVLTMVLGGLWHGAAWTFVLWGAYHGVLLAAHKALVDARPARREHLAIRLVKQVGTFHLVCLGWLFFRASGLAQVGAFLTVMLQSFTIDAAASRALFGVLLFAGMLWIAETWTQDRDDPIVFRGWRWGLGPAATATISVLLLVLTPLTTKQFIYFQF